MPIKRLSDCSHAMEASAESLEWRVRLIVIEKIVRIRAVDYYQQITGGGKCSGGALDGLRRDQQRSNDPFAEFHADHDRQRNRDRKDEQQWSDPAFERGFHFEWLK